MKPWTILLLVSLCGADNPEHLGLKATPALLLGPDNPLTLPLKFWANSRKSALKPRRRDLHEATLLDLLGHDYDPRWMRTARHINSQEAEDEPERKTVRALRALLSNSTLGGGGKADLLQLPEGLPPEYRELVKSWLVQRATCPIIFVWNDLGAYFWPRWLRRGECAEDATCSWPPGMRCVPGGARNLNVLRWHCRLRKNLHGRKKKKNENNVLATSTMSTSNSTEVNNRRKKRKKYRCLWIKVPYPVPEDCVCACS